MEECFTLFPIIHHLTTDHDSIATIASEVGLSGLSGAHCSKLDSATPANTPSAPFRAELALLTAARTCRQLLLLACMQVVQDFAADNVVYAELRTTPKVRDGMTKESYVEAVIAGVAQGQQHVQQRWQQELSEGRNR